MSLALALTEGEPLETDRTILNLAIRAALQLSRPQPTCAARSRPTCTLLSAAQAKRHKRQARGPERRGALVPELKSNQHELEHTTVPIRRRVCSL